MNQYPVDYAMDTALHEFKEGGPDPSLCAGCGEHKTWHVAAPSKLETWTEVLKDDPEYIAEGWATAFVEDVLRILSERKMTQAQLAKKMGVSTASVSRLFVARPTMTLEMIARVAVALQVRPRIIVDPERSQITAITVALSEPSART